jgi:hypothetical protein
MNRRIVSIARHGFRRAEIVFVGAVRDAADSRRRRSLTSPYAGMNEIRASVRS